MEKLNSTSTKWPVFLLYKPYRDVQYSDGTEIYAAFIIDTSKKAAVFNKVYRLFYKGVSELCTDVQKVFKIMNPAQNTIILVPKVSTSEK